MVSTFTQIIQKNTSPPFIFNKDGPSYLFHDVRLALRLFKTFNMSALIAMSCVFRFVVLHLLPSNVDIRIVSFWEICQRLPNVTPPLPFRYRWNGCFHLRIMRKGHQLARRIPLSPATYLLSLFGGYLALARKFSVSAAGDEQDAKDASY